MNYQSSNNSDSGFLRDIFTESGTPIRLIWRVLQGVLTFASCISLLLEFYEPYQVGFSGFIAALELIAILFFTLDYLGTLYFSEERLGYVFSFWGLVDLLSILPFFLLMTKPESALMLKGLRALRFLRVLRIIRIARGGF